MPKIYGIYDDYTIDFVATEEEAKEMVAYYWECFKDNAKGCGNSIKLFNEIPSWEEVEQLKDDGWIRDDYTVRVIKIDNGYVIGKNLKWEAEPGKSFGSWDWDDDDIEEVSETVFDYMYLQN